jgi:hypothetical protein
MPRTIRFHLDENCSQALAGGLRRRGIDVTTTSDAGLIGASDELHVAYATREGRAVFTHDKDFVRLHAAGTPHRGIVYCQEDKIGIGALIDGLVLLWEIYEPEEMVGRVEYL